MFAEERPPPKKIFTPDGKYEFVEDGALGTGACGVVRIAKHLETGELYAIKIMSVTGRLSEFVKEMTAYGKVTGHPNVVTLHESQVDLDKKRVYLIMELCRGGELFDRIAETGKMEEVVARRYFAQMVSAMDHCHARSVFHRDLKPENILLGGTSLDEIKVADFGLAALLSQVDHGDGGHFLNHTKCGSIMYAAPELLLSTERVGYDSATADIWSLGVILYSMLAGALPFKVALAARCPRFAWVEQHGLGPICAHLGLSPEASEVLQAMLRPVSSERPSLAQILECAWLQPIAHELPQRQAPGTPSRRAAAAPPTPKAAAAASPGMFGKWCEEITLCPMEVEAAASSGGGGGGGESSKRPAEHSCPAAEALEQAAKRARGAEPGARPEVEEPEGVNGMLVRSLGWVQLPSDKEQMVRDVTSALDSLGCRYSIERGELCNVVTATRDFGEGEAAAGAAAGPLSVEHGDTPPPSDGTPYASGQLTVRLRLHPNSIDSSTSDLHIERDDGPVMQFHSFYRDIRSELTGINGWSQNLGRYMREAEYK